MKIEVMACDELGALGGAICASIASRVYEDYSDAIKHMTHVRDIYVPDPNLVQIFQNKFRIYKRAIHSLRVFQEQESEV